SDGKVHAVNIKLSDYQNNITEVKFQAKCPAVSSYVFPPREKRNAVAYLPCNQDNTFETQDFRFYIPKGTLFDTLDLEYRKTNIPPDKYSPVHYVHNGSTPLNSNCVVSLKAEGLPTEYRSKACIGKVAGKNQYSYIGGQYENGWVTALTRKFGAFVIVVDKTPPSVTEIGNSTRVRGKGKKKTVVSGGGNKLTFRIGDNFSGIGSYCGYMNGEWVLMEYDFKRYTLTYHFDSAMKPGRNKFELFVTDKMGNTTTFSREVVL
ncbi:MAG: hypothetical protein NTU44_16840, partial [Bacteroidetes bacterium]|nr:hypothetical protein [Bacteroidota bacterium]